MDIEVLVNQWNKEWLGVTKYALARSAEAFLLHKPLKSRTFKAPRQKVRPYHRPRGPKRVPRVVDPPQNARNVEKSVDKP